MKILKFSVIVAFILLIFFGIPFLVYNNGKYNHNYTTAEGTTIKGPLGYYSLIIEDENVTTELKTKTANLFKEFDSVLKGESKELYNLVLTTASLISILIIIIGIIIRVTIKSKLYSNAIITSGILTFILYLIVYFVDYIFIL